jgi:hypothetical protein
MENYVVTSLRGALINLHYDYSMCAEAI